MGKGLLFIGIMQDVSHEGAGREVQRASGEGNAIQQGIVARGMQDEIISHGGQYGRGINNLLKVSYTQDPYLGSCVLNDTLGFWER